MSRFFDLEEIIKHKIPKHNSQIQTLGELRTILCLGKRKFGMV